MAGFRKGSNIGFDVADLLNKSKVGKVVLFVENGILKTAIDTANKKTHINKRITNLFKNKEFILYKFILNIDKK